MKRFITYLIGVVLVSVAISGCKNEDPDRQPFDNKIYIDATAKVNSTLLKGSVTTLTKTIVAGVAMPAPQEISIHYKADASLVDIYNQAYYDKAILLRDAFYEIPETRAKIPAGSVRSTEIEVQFKDLNELSRDTVYVLPVTMADVTGMEILESARTAYYVFKGGALINVVANISENYLKVNWKNPNVANGLRKLTLEALFRAHSYDRQISTVMGIEGKFLIRIGDAGFYSDQIQIATSSGNVPDQSSEKRLPKDEWIHLAVTYDADAREICIFINGKLQSQNTKYVGAVDLGVGGNDGFQIGRSYADDRYLDGEISECRIWNVVRTQEEIADNPYEVDPQAPGLVAYWKFDEGAGTTVKDRTGNGNDAVAQKPADAAALTWVPVQLPEAKK